MTNSIRRLARGGLLALTTALLALSLAGGLTLAKTTSKVKKHKIHGTGRLTMLDQSPTYPAPGSTAVDTGTLTTNLGSGAVIQKVRITSHPTSTTYTFTARATDFYSKGTVKATISGTATLNSNGSISTTGSGRYKGGTGRYKKAKGKFTFAGSSPAPAPLKPNVLTVTVQGSISY